MRAILLILALTPAACGQTPVAQIDLPEALTAETLRELDLFRHRNRDYRDNAFQFAERQAAYSEAAAALQGRELLFPVSVERVGLEEVLLRPVRFANTRVIFRFYDAEGGLQHGIPRPVITYQGPPTSRRYSLLARPSVLRVGVEVSPTFARELRQGDILAVTGRIDGLHARLEAGGNSADTILFVAEMTVKEQVFGPDDEIK